MFLKNPGNLYRFYKEESSFVHADRSEMMESCSGIDKIKQRITEIALPEGTTIDFKEGFLDAQKTENDAVFLLVTANFTHPTQPPRPFVQSFVLASQINPAQAGSGASYYVRNSVFRMVPGAVTVTYVEKVVEVPVPLPTPVQAVVPLPPVHVVETQPEVDAKKEAEEESAYSQPQSSIADQVLDKEDDDVPAEEPSAAPAPQSKSFADMVKGWGAPAAAGRLAKPQAPVVVKPVEEKPPSTSLYVKELDPTKSQADIEAYFSVYGQVLRVEISPTRSYAFVDFAAAESVQAVMAKFNAGPMVFGDKELKIEEKALKGKGGKHRGDKGGSGGEGKEAPSKGEKQQGEKQQGDKRGKPRGDREGKEKENKEDRGEKGGRGDRRSGGGGGHKVKPFVEGKEAAVKA